MNNRERSIDELQAGLLLYNWEYMLTLKVATEQYDRLIAAGLIREDEKPVMTERDILDVISKHRGGLYPDDFDIARDMASKNLQVLTIKPVVDLTDCFSMYSSPTKDPIKRAIIKTLEYQGFEVKS